MQQAVPYLFGYVFLEFVLLIWIFVCANFCGKGFKGKLTRRHHRTERRSLEFKVAFAARTVTAVGQCEQPHLTADTSQKPGLPWQRGGTCQRPVSAKPSGNYQDEQH